MRTKRDVPLETCPDLDCVRSGRCRARRPEHECRKFHMTVEERRHELADKLEAYHQEFMAENPGFVPREMSDEEVRYELRKALAQTIIDMGGKIPSHMIPPETDSEHLRKLREESDRFYNRTSSVDASPLDRPEGSS